MFLIKSLKHIFLTWTEKSTYLLCGSIIQGKVDIFTTVNVLK